VKSTVETIILVRHDVSSANIDPSVYKQLPDHTIPLADPKSERLVRAGQLLRTLSLPPEKTASWCSPYVRCAQTEAGVLEHAFGEDASRIRRREAFLLREQDFGDWDSLTDDEAKTKLPDSFAKRQRLTDNLGKFYFRYPNGESRADVVQRIILFFGKLHRSDFSHHIVFLHGVSQRAFRMAWRNLPVDWFEEEPNPGNASVLLIRRDATGAWHEQYMA